jgi:phosphotransferase system HPr (HPr) family protein
MEKIVRTTRIVNELGLHARSAALVARIAQKASAGIWLAKGNDKADARSIMDILALECPRGTRIRLIAEDAVDSQILDEIVRRIEDGFGE